MAGDTFHIRVDGTRELDRTLRELGLQVSDLRGTFREIAVRAARLAKGFAPKRSGRLASTIRPSNASGYASISAGRGIRYGAVQEFGWPAHRIQGSHYMERADEAIRPELVARITAGVDRAIREKGLA
jgi:hypothetical protein